MPRWTLYNTITGEFSSYVLDIPDNEIHLYSNGDMHVIDGEFDYRTEFMGPTAPQPRPQQSTSCDKTTIQANGVDVATISGLPVPCTIEIQGPVSSTIDVTDGILEFSADVPGDYTVHVKKFPYLDAEVVIHAI